MSATLGEWSTEVRIPVPPTVRMVDNPHNASPVAIDDPRGLFVLHAVLLHTGKVLWFCGHVELSHYPIVSYVFDPKNPAATLIPIPLPAAMDLFCCHYVQLSDGRIMAVGGSADFHTGLTLHGGPADASYGAQFIAFFDPITERWTPSTYRLDQGRWYPTAVLGNDGKVYVFSGRLDPAAVAAGPTIAAIAEKVEVLAPPTYQPQNLAGAEFHLPIYPGLHLCPDGKIYFTGTTWGQEIPNPNTRALNLSSGSWETFGGTRRPAQNRREEGMSVLLPLLLPGHIGRILLVGGSEAQNISDIPLLQGGGGPNGFHHIASSTDATSAEILDTSSSPPVWSAAGTLAHGRINCSCILLPDATVFVLGGHNKYKWHPSPNTTPSLVCEIFNGTMFTQVASLHKPRMYHSAAVLLPDGSVVVAGGADPNEREPPLTYPAGWQGPRYTGLFLNRKDYEFYRPTYFFKPGRPTITNILRNGVAAAQVYYGQIFTITTPNAADITRVAIMRPGAPTHHTDSEQRFVELSFTRSSGSLTVMVVSNKNVAPPGYYMVWIINGAQHDLPCEEAKFVQLTDMPPAPVTPSSSFCFIASAALGSPEHYKVFYLQQLRTNISESGKLGNSFIQMINALYYLFSPRIAYFIQKNEKSKWLTRHLVVNPVVFTVSLAERFTKHVKSKELRYSLLIGFLLLESVLSPFFLSILVVIILYTCFLTKKNKHA